MEQVLAGKGTQVWSIAPGATVFEGLRLMAERDIGSLVVVEQGRPVGVLSERDYARKVVLKQLSSHQTPVSVVMTTAFAAVPPQTTVDACMALMMDRRCRHVLVMEGDQLRGVVSIGDLVKATIEEQRFTIGELERYIGS